MIVGVLKQPLLSALEAWSTNNQKGHHTGGTYFQQDRQMIHHLPPPTHRLYQQGGIEVRTESHNLYSK
jgi:hypothetical protein